MLCGQTKGRHDGKPWAADGDTKRSKKSSALFPAFLVEVRGDWAMRKEVFSFPGWGDKKGCCHLCTCKPEELRNFESDRSHEKLPHYTLMSSILEAEGSTNELFQSPGPTSAQFLLDCLRMLEGSNLTEKVRALFQKIQE